VLNRTKQTSIGVKPESGQSYEYSEQKSHEQDLATTPPPEEKADQRSDHHHNRIEDWDPTDSIFTDNETMIESDFDEKNTEPSDQY
jgi:hypothetical protein